MTGRAQLATAFNMSPSLRRMLKGKRESKKEEGEVKGGREIAQWEKRERQREIEKEREANSSFIENTLTWNLIHSCDIALIYSRRSSQCLTSLSFLLTEGLEGDTCQSQQRACFWSIQNQLLSVYLEKHPGESTMSSPISPWSCLRYDTNELSFSLWP